MTYRDPWTRDIAALRTAGIEMLRQLDFLAAQKHKPHERLRALLVESQAAKAARIAARMERRFERESAERAAGAAEETK